MGGLFGGGGASKPLPPAPPPPGQDAGAVESAAAGERQRLAATKGRGATILTATSDVQKPSAGKTLLGS